MSEQAQITPKELARFCAECAAEKQAEEVKILNVGEVSSIADCFVIGTANSEPQLRAITGFVEREVREHYRLRPLSECGDAASGWVLLDFGTVLVHIMTGEMRQRYNLEGLWGAGDRLEEIRQVEKLTSR